MAVPFAADGEEVSVLGNAEADKDASLDLEPSPSVTEPELDVDGGGVTEVLNFELI